MAIYDALRDKSAQLEDQNEHMAQKLREKERKLA